MEEELALLRARVDMLERREEYIQGIIDGVAAEVSSINELAETFIMPALLLLGGDAMRDRMLRWLEKLAALQRGYLESEGTGAQELARLEYWHDVLRKREPWPLFPPDGWMSPRAPGDREGRSD